MKLKALFVILACISFGAFSLQAQDELKEGWNRGGDLGINITQTGFTNWAAGGDNSVGYTGLINLFAIKKQGRGIWENRLKLNYGEIGTGRFDDLYWKKVDDYIGILSKYGYQASEKWYYTVFGEFATQFAPAYDYAVDPLKTTAISKFLSPGILSAGVGMDYKPNDNFSLFLSPLTARVIMVMDDTLAARGAFGVTPSVSLDGLGNVVPGTGSQGSIENIKFELGALARAWYRTKLTESISFETTLGLFLNYLEEDFGNVDVDWQTLLTAKINQYINVNFATHLKYDNDTDIKVFDKDGVQTGYGPRVQFKEVLSIGFAYKF